MGIFIKKSASTNENINKWSMIYKSEVPEYIDAANKIYNKEYDSAIADLKNQLKNTSQIDFQKLSMIHINLMQAYFKNRDAHLEYFELSNFHAKEALKFGHNTGLAPFRLIVNLEKQNKLNLAIEVCDIVTDENYKFSIHGYKQKEEFIERLEKLKLRLKKNGDINNATLFSEEERKMTIENSIRNK